jgi:site-specific DNA-methyltransferase (adenine-specific)
MALLKETSNGNKRQRTPKVYQSFQEDTLNGEIYHTSALHFLRSLPEGAVDLVFLDPPFNLGKKYGRARKMDRRPEAEYQSWMQEILIEGVRVLADGGALYLYHTPLWGMRFGAFLEQYISLRHWVAISMKSGFVRGDRLYPAHYALLYFTKGSPSWFKRPKIEPVLCRKCGESVKDYGGYASIIEEKGINLSDFWEDISPVRHANRKFRSANELPTKMTDRVIEISGKPGGLFVDPFSGSGTAVLSAARAKMRFAACDLLIANCRLVCQRLEGLSNGDNNVR